MTEPLVSLAEIQHRARQAVDDGKPIAACPFPAHSAAAAAWREAYQVRLAELTNEAVA